MTNKPQRVPLDALVPYWRNPRENTAAIGAVKASIESFGFHVPIIVDQNNVIIAGHSAYKALKILNEKFAWVIISDMSPEKAKEYRIVDNKTAEISQWNRPVLAAELLGLGEGVETLRPFFDPVDLGALLGEPVVPALETGNVAPAAITAEDGGILKVPCPHCGEENQIDKRQFA